ncbi:MAG: NAD(P)/FAD-dependent oxidoreductase [Desulfobacterium sp.]|nr:NAD(P)/FAD-dependent oxidoreductase [Desulfobacterium sp.]MBU3949360.1 NAD(P)/FAD-dependent oxidoreductase [Pseudomonadota bacterium]MBU4010646.1 NAD(P)/FAD-dependent oxidoreductase [Pseudomonadota bacterium]MBU4037353.1 NAD(P)/FAD-dependent oxidoreductase [Pseudomonadota bacterium]
MSRKLNYDLVIVGAGPAGTTAASIASGKGIRTLIVEKKTCIGSPVQCAEHIPRLLTQQVNFNSRCIAQEVGMMITYMPGGDIIETKAPGYIIDRSLFDKGLALDAISKGADLMIRTVAVSRNEKGIIVKTGGKEVSIEAKVIIGGDGPNSTVGGWINRRNNEFVSAAQCEVLLNKPIESTLIYFGLEYMGGYGWLFPKGQTANVGVGINNKIGRQKLSVCLKHLLDRLQKEEKIRDKSAVSYTAGLIPVGGCLDTSPYENILIIGDAAGQTDPITGAGIPQAVSCGRIAGEVAAKAIKENNLVILGEYEKRWKNLFGRSLDNAYQKRKLLDNHWKDEQLDQIIRKTWVAFDEYWRQ